MTARQEHKETPASPRQLPLGALLISAFYLFGALVLLVTAVTNPLEVSTAIALRHGLPAGTGVPVLLAVAALGFTISYGLATLSRWGWFLTTGYLAYFGAVSLILSLGGLGLLETGDLALRDYIGNLTWSVIVVLYLFVRRDRFLGQR